MILDRRENALCYLGISPEMDAALRFAHDMDATRLEVDSKIELQGKDVFYRTFEVALQQRPMRFEYHRAYIDVHLPVTGKEQIAFCSATPLPADATYDPEKDFGEFDRQPVNVVTVPEGWFCICFPDDAHVPGIGEDGHAIVKVVIKAKA